MCVRVCGCGCEWGGGVGAGVTYMCAGVCLDAE